MPWITRALLFSSLTIQYRDVQCLSYFGKWKVHKGHKADHNVDTYYKWLALGKVNYFARHLIFVWCYKVQKKKPVQTSRKADPPARESKSTTSFRPITLKNAFGSIPCAVEKSVPVFLSECIAARTACTIATQDTKEKTKRKKGKQFEPSSKISVGV
jgi:hypothetical protein